MPLSWNEIRHRAIQFAHYSAGTFTEVLQRFLIRNEPPRGVKVLKAVCGMLVILCGVWLIYSAPDKDGGEARATPAIR
jgi:hypothetical protein